MNRLAARALLFASLLLAGGCASEGGAGIPVAANESATPDPAATPSKELGHSAESPLPITWDDLVLPLPPDSNFESWMLTSRAKSVVDRYVQVKGYIYGGIQQKDGIRTFPLLRDIDCPFGPGGHAHHAIEVNLQGKLRTSYTRSPVTVEGFLTVSPFTGTDGKTWSVYHLEGTKIQ
jgi:hypothetical protein